MDRSLIFTKLLPDIFVRKLHNINVILAEANISCSPMSHLGSSSALLRSGGGKASGPALSGMPAIDGTGRSTMEMTLDSPLFLLGQRLGGIPQELAHPRTNLPAYDELRQEVVELLEAM
ncbi:hypothetical protein [Geminicoccus sp.]|uniref:hypothetical protein n=1 Tax=Geminicoccus sp. TaxID=2024832 RepID=UPI002D7E5383|nr:hypothetical protein [Geminicoccus sp.]